MMCLTRSWLSFWRISAEACVAFSVVARSDKLTNLIWNCRFNIKRRIDIKRLKVGNLKNLLIYLRNFKSLNFFNWSKLSNLIWIYNCFNFQVLNFIIFSCKVLRGKKCENYEIIKPTTRVNKQLKFHQKENAICTAYKLRFGNNSIQSSLKSFPINIFLALLRMQFCDIINFPHDNKPVRKLYHNPPPLSCVSFVEHHFLFMFCLCDYAQF